MTFQAIILWAAKTVKVSGPLLLAICTHESGLKNITVPHDGGSPSIGICQVKYETAKMLGYQGTPHGLTSPKTNALYAARYLKYQLQRYNHDFCRATAAYNAGTFNESEKYPGYPRNLKYIKYVEKKLDPRLRYKLICERKVAKE